MTETISIDSDEYVSPPCYTDTKSVSSEISLISKLQSRIEKDIQQINGVYDDRIKEENSRKAQLIAEIEKEYDENVNIINITRKAEIGRYNEKAEKYIDNLINNDKIVNNHWFIDYIVKLISK